MIAVLIKSIIVCLLGHYLRFTFFAVKKKKKNCWKRRESLKISSGLYAGSGWENPHRWSVRNWSVRFKDFRIDASENNKSE